MKSYPFHSSAVSSRLAEIIGPEATDRLMKERAGTNIFIPTKANAQNSALAQIIGTENTIKLSKDFATGQVALPCAGYSGASGRRREAIGMLKAGKSLADTARACKISIRSVSNYAAQIQDERQKELPFDK